MDLLIRTLLIWLLTIAIPAQGVAAATMAFCGPTHHGSSAAALADRAATTIHSHADHGATTAHEHLGFDASATTLDEPGVSSEGKVDSADQHKCNVCGACCSTGAMMGGLPVLPTADAASASFSSVGPAVDPFAADGPDRPPRNRLV